MWKLEIIYSTEIPKMTILNERFEKPESSSCSEERGRFWWEFHLASPLRGSSRNGWHTAVIAFAIFHGECSTIMHYRGIFMQISEWLHFCAATRTIYRRIPSPDEHFEDHVSIDPITKRQFPRFRSDCEILFNRWSADTLITNKNSN